MCISFQTLEELWYGAHSGGWGGKRKNKLKQHLNQYEVIWSTEELVDICASLRSASRSAGRSLQIADAWIAGTALLLHSPLASEDRDFDGIPNLHLIRAN